MSEDLPTVLLITLTLSLSLLMGWSVGKSLYQATEKQQAYAEMKQQADAMSQAFDAGFKVGYESKCGNK